MAEQLLDVLVECDYFNLLRQSDATQAIAEASKHAAEEKCLATGVRLRHPDPREVVVKRAVAPTGGDVLLVATRWLVDGPEQPLG